MTGNYYRLNCQYCSSGTTGWHVNWSTPARFEIRDLPPSMVRPTSPRTSTARYTCGAQRGSEFVPIYCLTDKVERHPRRAGNSLATGFMLLPAPAPVGRSREQRERWRSNGAFSVVSAGTWQIRLNGAIPAAKWRPVFLPLLRSAGRCVRINAVMRRDRQRSAV